MTAPSIHASEAHAFDPATWLTEFESFGGGYTLGENLNLIIAVRDQTDDQLSHARAMIVGLTPRQRLRLVAYLCRRDNAGEVDHG